MFDPLTADELAMCPTGRTDADRWQPIVPPPSEPSSTELGHCRWGEPVAVFPYFDASGQLEGYVRRYNFTDANGEPAKEFLPLRYGILDGRTGWHCKGWGDARPLFRLPELLATAIAVPVIVTEGELKADCAAQLFPDHAAVSPMNGSGSPHWTDWSALKGRDVVVWPDNDDAGQVFASKVAELCHGAGALRVRVVAVPPEFPPKWDLGDVPPDGWDADKLRRLLDAAQPIGQGTDEGGARLTPGPNMGSYRFLQEGLYFIPDEAVGDIHLSGPFQVLAETRDTQGTNWGVLLAWHDHDGRLHRHALARATLAGDGADARRVLMDGGLYVSSQRGAREKLNTYLATVRVKERARAVTRIGWHDRTFVLPDDVIGDSGGEMMILQTPGPISHEFHQQGTLEEWQQAIALPALGNSRLVTALSAAFAAPLLHLTDQESGGIHFRGASSIGKSTMLLVAASVWGGGGVKGYVRQWRATDNGLEAVARHHCDALLCLDELSQVEAKAAGQAAYMLANGTGKSRAQVTGDARACAEWRLLFLSSGEISLADKLAEDGRGRKVMAGQEVRVIDIPADAGAGFGAFEDCHGQEPAAFAQSFKKASQQYYGTAARAFIGRCAEDPEWVRQAVTSYVRDFVEEFCPKGADGQVRRVAMRFALIAAAGELAILWGILPWADGVAMAGVAACFRAWMEARGGLEPFEVSAGISQVRHFIEVHGEGRFTPLDGGGAPETERVTINRAGFRERDYNGGWVYYVLPQVWKNDLCAGFDPTMIAKALAERGMLETRSCGKLQVSKRLPGYSNASVYKLLPSLLDGEGDA